MPVRPATAADAQALRAFFDGLPDADAVFLKEDLTDDVLLPRWIADGQGIRLLHVDEDGHVAAATSVVFGLGRSDHVADLRLVVDAGRRRRGVGRELAQAAVVAAVRAGARKITVEVGALQEGAITLFRGLGFVPEALHGDHVRADDGTYLDVMVLAHNVADHLEPSR